MCEKKKEFVKKNNSKTLAGAPPPSFQKPGRAFFFCIYPRQGPRPLSRTYPRSNPMIIHTREMRLVRWCETVIRFRFVSRPTCLARVDIDVSTLSSMRRAHTTRHTTTRDGYRFDDNVALFGDERTNERRTRSTHTARRSIDTRALVSLSTETRIERRLSTDDTMSGRYSRKNNDGVRAKRRCDDDDDDDDDDDEREYGDAMRRCGSRLGFGYPARLGSRVRTRRRIRPPAASAMRPPSSGCRTPGCARF